MKSFYALTPIRIAIVDISCHEVMGYPEHFTDFCAYMRANSSSCHNCSESDFNGFEHYRKTGKIHIYKCHARLTEAAYSLKENESIIGYIMYGQFTDSINQTKICKAIRKFK